MVEIPNQSLMDRFAHHVSMKDVQGIAELLGIGHDRASMGEVAIYRNSSGEIWSSPLLWFKEETKKR